MSPVTLVSLVALAGAAAWLLSGRDEALHRARLVTAGGGEGGASGASSWPPGSALSRCWREGAEALRTLLTPERSPVAAQALCVAVGLVLAVLLSSPVPALAGIGSVPVVRRLLRRRAARRKATRRRSAVIELCSTVAGELRTGRLPNEVLAAALAESTWSADPDMPGASAGVVAAARFGGDVPRALLRAARAPGAEGLAGMAACWQVALDRGTFLAEGLDRVAEALRADERQREDLEALLAGPKSTAALLAVLPVFGLALGSMMGAHPLRVLHTPAGLACLVLGVALECAGIAWTGRITRGAS
ncbi:type II secretion system F family protein [Wenjunlia tyrosinilytica]|uniref:Membrane protein n=1 Tax=Wenjunlia tyrosinilytica TaxID=1544741 RepID=A0A917ZS30_9ACTN|nr:type II secretion system F family protein [Wenjunlia tyrosinilytica]GGO89307.1 membrane protein [Wenjunlia tyrosinilytica]